eukprot:1256235-Rhodomonas_salina.1
MFVRLATAQVGIDWWSQVPGNGGESSNSNHDGSNDDDEDDSDDDDNGDRPVGRTENSQPIAHGPSTTNVAQEADRHDEGTEPTTRYEPVCSGPRMAGGTSLSKQGARERHPQAAIAHPGIALPPGMDHF